MLSEIRDRSSGVFAWVIAALIIIPMAFWGVQEYANTDPVLSIVEVGDEKITQTAYQQQLSAAQSQARQANPGLANTDVLTSDFYKKQVLQSMIDRSLTTHIANEHNYQVGVKQVDDLIRSMPNFQSDGKYDPALFEAQSAVYGRGGAGRLKNDLLNNTRTSQVSSGYQESALVLPSEMRFLLELQAEQRSFDLITVNQADYLDEIVVNDEDIAAYYESNVDNFMEPDRISVSYIELDSAAIANQITIDEEALRSIYEENKDSYISQETRSTRHILLSTSGGENEQAQLEKAQDLVTQLKAGADFASLAEENSQDPGSAKNGGSLGDVERGAMVSEFDAAMFALAEGELSEPIKTQFGYHIIQVEKINGGAAQPFADVRFDIEQEERERLADEKMLDMLDQLRNLVFEQPESLAGAAEQLGLTVKQTGLFSRAQGDGIASNEAIRSIAFSEQVAADGLNSEPVELAGPVYVAMRKLNFVASEPKKLADVSAQIKATISAERASDKAKLAGETLLATANDDWNKLAADESLKIDNYTVAIIDSERQVRPDIMREVFKLQFDDSVVDKGKVTSFSSANGDFNILRLTKVAPGDLSAVSEQVKDTTRRLLEGRNGRALFSAYISSLNEDLDLEIKEDLL